MHNLTLTPKTIILKSLVSVTVLFSTALASGSFRLYPPIFAEMKLFVEETKGKIVHDKLFNEITTDEQLSQRPGIQDIGNSVKSIADVYEMYVHFRGSSKREPHIFMGFEISINIRSVMRESA